MSDAPRALEAEMLRLCEEAAITIARLQRKVMEAMMESRDECACREKTAPRFPEPAPFVAIDLPDPGLSDDPPSRPA